jgi:tellurite resistance protein TerC
MDHEFLSWAIFGTIIVILLVLDLGVFNKKDHVISVRESIYISIFYITIACFFGIYVYYSLGSQSANEYFTGYLLEKSMSLDNIFVISIIFSFFHIPPKYQHRVLFWGILGVIILRAIMISLGALLLAKFSWILFVFAGILIVTGVKIFLITDHEKPDINNMYIYRLLKSKLNIYPRLVGNKFFVKESGKVFVTPLFMALITVETMDVVFAIDSIPAIFAVTQDSYIVYTCNIFAILGLRALFFLLADTVERFKYIKYSLALILIFIGIKIFVSHFIKIPTYIPLIITIALLGFGILFSLYKRSETEG